MLGGETISAVLMLGIIKSSAGILCDEGKAACFIFVDRLEKVSVVEISFPEESA